MVQLESGMCTNTLNGFDLRLWFVWVHDVWNCISCEQGQGNYNHNLLWVAMDPREITSILFQMACKQIWGTPYFLKINI
jgi:hypothetical protein